MITSAFEGFLVREPFRRKAARDGGFAIPTYQERRMDLSDEPLLVTNARRTFLRPGRSRGDIIRFGFSECPIEEEPLLLGELFRYLWALSGEQGWSNRCNSLYQAKEVIARFGLLPRTLVVPFAVLSRVCEQEISLEDARKLTVAQGCVAEIEGGIKVLFSELPENQMILATSPPLVGVYARGDDYLGLLLRKVDQTLVLIDELAG